MQATKRNYEFIFTISDFQLRKLKSSLGLESLSDMASQTSSYKVDIILLTDVLNFTPNYFNNKNI